MNTTTAGSHRTRRIATTLVATAALGTVAFAAMAQASPATQTSQQTGQTQMGQTQMGQTLMGQTQTSQDALTTVSSPAVFPDEVGDMNHGADIKRVRVVNGDKNVRVRVNHRNLRHSFRSGSSVAVYIDTDKSEAGPEYAFVGGTFEGSDYALVKTDGWKLRTKHLTCSYEMKLDYALETASIRIGRGCLDEPGAVRVAVKTGGEQADGDLVRDWLVSARHLTPWIARA